MPPRRAIVLIVSVLSVLVSCEEQVVQLVNKKDASEQICGKKM